MQTCLGIDLRVYRYYQTMLKVIQVKIQEQVSCREKNSETAQFNRSRDKLDRSKHVSEKFLFQPNCSLSPKRIRVSDLFLQVYKGNPKHVFIRLFKEKSVQLLHLGFCTQKTLSCLLPVLFLEESQDPVLQKLLPSIVIKGVNDLNLQGWSWSHKHESLCFLSQVWVLVAKA